MPNCGWSVSLNYAPFFLTVYEIINYARGLTPPILCQGRGSAANSLICYCLGITDVARESRSFVRAFRFQRIAASRRTSTSISSTNGAKRSSSISMKSMAASTPAWPRPSSAIAGEARSAKSARFLVFRRCDRRACQTLWGWSMEGVSKKEARRLGLDPSDPRLNQVMELADELIDSPRHLSQHVGGFVITRRGSTSSCRSRMRRWTSARSSSGTRTISSARHSQGRCAGARHADVSAARSSIFCIRHYGVTRDLSPCRTRTSATYDMI